MIWNQSHTSCTNVSNIRIMWIGFANFLFLFLRGAGSRCAKTAAKLPPWITNKMRIVSWLVFSRSSKLNSIGRAHAPPRQRRAHIYAHLVCMVWFVKVWTVRYIGIVSHAWFYGSMDLWHDVHLTFIGWTLSSFSIACEHAWVHTLVLVCLVSQLLYGRISELIGKTKPFSFLWTRHFGFKVHHGIGTEAWCCRSRG